MQFAEPQICFCREAWWFGEGSESSCSSWFSHHNLATSGTNLEKTREVENAILSVTKVEEILISFQVQRFDN